MSNVDIAENAETASTADKNKMIPDVVYGRLPEVLIEIVSGYENRERDIVFLSTLGVLSACLPKVFGVYRGKKLFPNLNVFIIAPPASGKGAMNDSKILIEPIHEKIMGDSKEIPDKKFQTKLLPGNVSSARVYTHLSNAHDSLLIFESEADSLSQMLKQDWGDFSDIMRKAFHHETVSLSRESDDKFIEIKKPKLSMVLSGTPNQLKPLISGKENGLFSRFMFYYFDEVTGWEDVSPMSNYQNNEVRLEDVSSKIYDLYGKLYFKENEIEVKLNEAQWDFFQDKMRLAANTFIENNKLDFLSVVKRMGVIFFRMCIILTVLRNENSIDNNTAELYCADDDLTTAFEVLKVIMEHSLYVFDLYDKNSVYLPMNERMLYNQLPQEFSRAIGISKALSVGIAERTFGNVLKRWAKNEILLKVSHGNYKKLSLK